MSTETGAWMPMYWGDYFGDTMHLNTEEHGAYLLLIGTYWRRAKPLPDDDKWLANVTKMSTKKWKMVRPIISQFFDISDGEWTHKRLIKETLRSNDRITSARTAGIASAQARRQPTTTTVTKKKEGYLTVSQESQFDDWWSIIPKKVGKGAAERKFKISLKITDFETLKAGAVRYAREAADKEPQFIVSPARWLHEKRWLDEPERKSHGNRHRGNGAGRPSAHDTMLAAHAFAAAPRHDAGTSEDIPPDTGGKGDAGKPAARVPRLPSARRAD